MGNYEFIGNLLSWGFISSFIYSCVISDKLKKKNITFFSSLFNTKVYWHIQPIEVLKIVYKDRNFIKLKVEHATTYLEQFNRYDAGDTKDFVKTRMRHDFMELVKNNIMREISANPELLIEWERPEYLNYDGRGEMYMQLEIFLDLDAAKRMTENNRNYGYNNQTIGKGIR